MAPPLRQWLHHYRVDCLMVIGLVALALALRVPNLEHIPPGLNGDEAWTGIDAQRIIDTGPIGPYVQTALGQPAGPLYYTVPFVAVFGHSAFAVRFAMATLGVATVAMTYVTFRIMFDRPTATAAAFLLCVSAWHLHFSRMGFMVISWPLIELVVLAFFSLGLRSNRPVHYALCGLALGAGLYTYNAYPVFLLPFGLLVACAALRHGRNKLPAYAARIGILTAFALLAALPMILYAADSSNMYSSHSRNISITRENDWESGGFAERAELMVDKARDVFTDMLWSGSPDVSDAFDADGVMDRVSLALLVLGIIISLWRWRQTPYLTLLLMLAFLPFASILTTGLGELRRTFGVAPFLAALQAIPIATLYRYTQHRRSPIRGLAIAAIGLVACAVMLLNLNYYFREFPDQESNRRVFSMDIADAARYMRDLPGLPYVYFYHDRLSVLDEVRLYFAPDLVGEDRSANRSSTRTVRLDIDRTRHVLFVFLQPYTGLADEVEQLYPGGSRYDESYADGSPKFRAYNLPALVPGATPPPDFTPVPTPTREVLPGGQDRDRNRMAEMQRIQQALASYRQKYQEFPTNGGVIQAFCAAESRDVGCQLSEFLDPLPRNPRDELTRAYFYVSNGLEYTLYAYRESDAVPACPEHPDALAHVVDLLCVSGP